LGTSFALPNELDHAETQRRVLETHGRILGLYERVDSLCTLDEIIQFPLMRIGLLSSLEGEYCLAGQFCICPWVRLQWRLAAAIR
jgi:hypothetical protein